MRAAVHMAAAAWLLVFNVGCSGDDDAGPADPAAFCDAADEERLTTLVDGLDPNDVDGSIATLTEALETERELQRVAPDAVRADVEILARFLDQLVRGLEEVDPNSPERPPIYEELRPEFDQVEAASARIERYVVANC